MGNKWDSLPAEEAEVVLTAEKLATWTQRTLEVEGPLTFPRLLSRLSCDSRYGFFALRASNIETFLRNSLAQYSSESNRLFSINHNYEWYVNNNQEVICSGNLESLPRSQAWLEMGKGRELVYGLFSPIQMERSWNDGAENYPVKIGRTSRPIMRRFLELQTGNYFELQLGVVIGTDTSSKLEKYIHTQLKHKQIVQNGRETEWFYTNLLSIRNLAKQYQEACSLEAQRVYELT